MEDYKVVHNYAQALFQKSKNPMIILQLQKVSHMIQKAHSIASLLGEITLEPEQRATWVRENLRNFLPEVKRFIYLLDEKNRLGLLDKIAIAYETYMFAENNMERIYITTATDVDVAYLDKIVTVFEKKEGKKLTREHRIDPHIIGGVKVKIGSKLYDDTIQKKLKNSIRKIKKEV